MLLCWADVLILKRFLGQIQNFLDRSYASDGLTQWFSELIWHFCQCFRMYGTYSRRSELSRTSHVAPVTDTTFWPKIKNKNFQKKWFFKNKILRKKWKIFFWKKNIFWFLRSFRIGWLTFSCSGRLRGAGNQTILSRYPARPSIAATFHCDHSDFLDFLKKVQHLSVFSKTFWTFLAGNFV